VIGEQPTSESTTTQGNTEDYLSYNIYEDHAEVAKCDSEAVGEIVIPEEIDGVPVTRIGEKAFEDCESLKSITIPNSVTSIGYDAFYKCRILKSVTIPDSVTSIGDAAFFECESLKLITIPDSVTDIGANVFLCCESLKSITIPDSVTTIEWYAFGRCTNLESITIPDSVTIIGIGAFSNCTSLESITIPDSVTDIGASAFRNCKSLESITILNPACGIYDVILDSSFAGTVYGYEGSTAQLYAGKYGYKFESLGEAPTSGTELEKGDANGDNSIDMSDVVIVMQACLNPKKYGVNGTSPDRITADGEKAGDVDGKAGLTANDALLIQKFALKLIDKL
jgi:hypothetical protein